MVHCLMWFVIHCLMWFVVHGVITGVVAMKYIIIVLPFSHYTGSVDKYQLTDMWLIFTSFKPLSCFSTLYLLCKTVVCSFISNTHTIGSSFIFHSFTHSVVSLLIH